MNENRERPQRGETLRPASPIIVCDWFGFVHDLVLHLYQNGLTKFIEVYVPQVNSVTPQVVDGLLDANCNKTMIKGFVISKFPTDKFVHAKEQVEVDSSVAGGLCPEWQPRHGQDLYQ